MTNLHRHAHRKVRWYWVAERGSVVLYSSLTLPGDAIAFRAGIKGSKTKAINVAATQGKDV